MRLKPPPRGTPTHLRNRRCARLSAAPPPTPNRSSALNRHAPPAKRRAAAITAALALLVFALPACAPASVASTDPCAPGAVPVGPTPEDLQAALDGADPGDVLQLADTVYADRFTITASGTADAPITLCGTADSILDGGSPSTGYALHLDGADHWVLDGFTVTGAAKGVMLDASDRNVLRGLTVHGTGEEGIHVRTHSSDNRIESVTVRDTGRTRAEYGEGIYIGSANANWCRYTECEPDRSDRNEIVRVTVADVAAEAIDIKEGTTGGVVRDSVLSTRADATADAVVDVKGSEWMLRGNEVRSSGPAGIQVFVLSPPWGSRNAFEANRFTFQGDAAGTGISLVGDARSSGNRVACDNGVPEGSRIADAACG